MKGSNYMDVLNKSLIREKACAEQPGQSLQIRQPNLTEQLEMRLEMHEAEAAKLKEAIDAVKKNPELEHVLSLLQRL
jgi:hypothetical protein